MVNLLSVISEIVEGQHDKQLSLLAGAIQDRQRELGIDNHYENGNSRGSGLDAYKFKPGEKVVFNEAVNPKYLIGAMAVVKRVKRTRVVIHLDESHGRFHSNCDITAYPNTLSKAS